MTLRSVPLDGARGPSASSSPTPTDEHAGAFLQLSGSFALLSNQMSLFFIVVAPSVLTSDLNTSQ